MGNGAEAHEPEDVRRARSSPLVRRIAKEHNIDISSLHGSGVGGRVTKHDILDYLDQSAGAPSQPQAHIPAFKPGERVEIAPMGVMRKKIAEHMVLSRRTAAHVHSVFEVNFRRVAQLREQKKAEYERQGTKLTFLAFIARAVVESLIGVPGPELVARRRQHRLQEGHQSRHRRRARLGPDRPGGQERRREEPARPEPDYRRSGRRAPGRNS